VRSGSGRAASAYQLAREGDAHYRAGHVQAARAQYEQVFTSQAASVLRWYAALRLAQLDFDARQFGRARRAAESLLREPLPLGLRGPALVLAAESSYGDQAYQGAAALYRRFLSDFPSYPEAPRAAFALAWTEFRLGRPDTARFLWTRFSQDFPLDPRASEALLLAAEIAERAGDTEGARSLLDTLIARFPDSAHADVAILNRAILAIRIGHEPEALRDLSELARRGSPAAYAGRVRLLEVTLSAPDRRAQPNGQARQVAAPRQGTLASYQPESGSQEPVASRSQDGPTERPDGAGSPLTGIPIPNGGASNAPQPSRNGQFDQLAPPLLSGPGDPATTPYVLHALVILAAQEEKWVEARELALWLVTDFAGYAAAPAVLGRLGAIGARDAQWRLAREMYELAADRYPGSPADPEGRMHFAEALFHTGALPEARDSLQTFVQSAPAHATPARVLLLLAEAHQALGNWTGALEAYARLRRDHPSSARSAQILLSHARAALESGQGDQARPLLREAIDRGDSRVAIEAAYRMAQMLREREEHEPAVEWYMTAAYLAPHSTWARYALLGAARSLRALKQADSAARLYRKLLASDGVEPELLEYARRELSGEENVSAPR
jgi:TolA-binding protein